MVAAAAGTCCGADPVDSAGAALLLLLRALAVMGPILWILPGSSAALLLQALAVLAGFGCTAAAGTCCCGAYPAVSPRFGWTAAGSICCCVAVSVDCAGFVACCTASAVAITCGSSSADFVGFASGSMAMGSGAGGCTSGFKVL